MSQNDCIFRSAAEAFSITGFCVSVTSYITHVVYDDYCNGRIQFYPSSVILMGSAVVTLGALNEAIHYFMYDNNAVQA